MQLIDGDGRNMGWHTYTFTGDCNAKNCMTFDDLACAAANMFTGYLSAAGEWITGMAKRDDWNPCNAFISYDVEFVGCNCKSGRLSRSLVLNDCDGQDISPSESEGDCILYKVAQNSGEVTDVETTVVGISVVNTTTSEEMVLTSVELQCTPPSTPFAMLAADAINAEASAYLTATYSAADNTVTIRTVDKWPRGTEIAVTCFGFGGVIVTMLSETLSDCEPAPQAARAANGGNGLLAAEVPYVDMSNFTYKAVVTNGDSVMMEPEGSAATVGEMVEGLNYQLGGMMVFDADDGLITAVSYSGSYEIRIAISDSETGNLMQNILLSLTY